MKKFIIILLLPVIIFNGCTTGKKNSSTTTILNAWYEKNYIYADGSANRYVFNKNSFEYIPVKPEESSTGTYDGGEYIKKQPDLNSFEKLVDLIQSAYGATADHIVNREKGSGRVEFYEGNTSTVFILQMNSPWRQQIESVLTEIKKKK